MSTALLTRVFFSNMAPELIVAVLSFRGSITNERNFQPFWTVLIGFGKSVRMDFTVEFHLFGYGCLVFFVSLPDCL